MTQDGAKGWKEVKKLLGKRRISFGKHISYWFYRTPRRALHSMSYYKFAARLIGEGKRVLDLGCGEGLGTWLLAAECGYAAGVDLDEDAIGKAQNNWNDPRVAFHCKDFLDADLGQLDAIVSFDVIEHILPQNTHRFFQKIMDCLVHNGIAIIGTPNISSHRYASKITRIGHVNLYSGDRLENQMSQYFHHVFMFGANDEVVHTGFLPMAHYLITVGCGKRI